MKKVPIFEGSAAALATPMKAGGEIDFEAMGRLVDFVLEEGTDALLVNGTTGESATLEERERLEVIRFVVDRTAGRVPVIAGTGSNSTAHGISLSKEAARLGADALLLVTPYYNKATQAGLVTHFFRIAEAVPCPALVYNVPGRTGVTILPETYQRLAEHPNLYGTKEAGGDLSAAARTAALCGEDFAIYSGCDDQTLALMALGARGVISVAANVIPGPVHQMCRGFLEGRIEESRRLQLEQLELMNALFWEVNPIPLKAALSLMGLCGDSCRLPLTPMTKENKEKLKTLLERYGVLDQKAR